MAYGFPPKAEPARLFGGKAYGSLSAYGLRLMAVFYDHR